MGVLAVALPEPTDREEIKTMTKSSINAHLPRLDTLRRNYAPLGTVGEAYWRAGYLRAAIADIDQAQRHVTDITIYSYSDAMTPSHYRGGGVDITECVEGALRDHEITRSQLIASIQDSIIETLSAWEDGEN